MSLLKILQPSWGAPGHIHCASTLRAGGVSRIPYKGLNLGMHVGDDSYAVEANRELLKASLKLPDDPLWLNQIHSNRVIDLDKPLSTKDADAVISRKKGVVCSIMTADCLPVLLTNQKGTAVAAAHAGWRGLCDDILEQTVVMMASPNHEILAWLGPAIGAQHFEVGEEVRQQFIVKNPQTVTCFATSQNKGKWMADIYQLAKIRLAAVGVTQVWGGEHCTYTEDRDFYSYRRDGVTGRMASLIWMA